MPGAAELLRYHRKDFAVDLQADGSVAAVSNSQACGKATMASTNWPATPRPGPSAHGPRRSRLKKSSGRIPFPGVISTIFRQRK